MKSLPDSLIGETESVDTIQHQGIPDPWKSQLCGTSSIFNLKLPNNYKYSDNT